MLASKYQGGKFLGMSLILKPAQDPTQITGWVRLRELLMYLDIIFMLLTSSHFTPLNMCPVLRLHTSNKKIKMIIIIITRSNNVSKVVSRNLKIAFSLRDNKNPSLDFTIYLLIPYLKH